VPAHNLAFTVLNRTTVSFQDYLEDYNRTASKQMKLVFFMDCIEHITRLARTFRSERGNALLVGVGGVGKKSLTRLASHLCCHK
jgi:dynein heavy chain